MEEYVTLVIDIQNLIRNTYTKDNNENKQLSYLQYWDANNLYVWALSQKLPVNHFKRFFSI